MANVEKTMEKIVALAKARGFVYPGSEIYGGLANTWDYGPLGSRLKNAIKDGRSVEELAEISKMDAFFLYKIENIVEFEKQVTKEALEDEKFLLKAKKLGFSNFTLAKLAGIQEEDVKALLDKFDIKPSYKMVDTCAGEFNAQTPYFYSSYHGENASRLTDKKKIIVLGAGPIRIGQGVEFDYSTVHAVMTIRKAGYEAIIINNNPETVSTDYTTADKLYFEPLTPEDVMNIIEFEKPEGVIASLGGQTAINLAQPLTDRGVKIIGTDCAAIDRAEDRNAFENLLNELNKLLNKEHKQILKMEQNNKEEVNNNDDTIFNEDLTDYNTWLPTIEKLNIDCPKYNHFYEMTFKNNTLYTAGGMHASAGMTMDYPGTVQVLKDNI